MLYNNQEKERKKKFLLILQEVVLVLFIMAFIYIIIQSHTVGKIYTQAGASNRVTQVVTSTGLTIEQNFLELNEYSRPATPLEEVTGIVLHYTGNPNTSAHANRNYFNNLKYTKETSASSHYIVGLLGEVIQCVPTTEIAYASKQRNKNTISIETCHPTEDGTYNPDTYEALVKLVQYICIEYNLNTDSILRHYDVTGKNCPKYFVEDEDAFRTFKEDVQKGLPL